MLLFLSSALLSSALAAPLQFKVEAIEICGKDSMTLSSSVLETEMGKRGRKNGIVSMGTSRTSSPRLEG